MAGQIYFLEKEKFCLKSTLVSLSFGIRKIQSQVYFGFFE